MQSVAYELSKSSVSSTAVVIVGPGQVATTVTLRSLGWRVQLAATIADGTRMAKDIDATLLVVRVREGEPLPAINLDHVTLIAIVDEDANTEDAERALHFDTQIEMHDVRSLARYARSVAPTESAIEVRVDRHSDVVPKHGGGVHDTVPLMPVFPPLAKLA